MKLRNFVKRYIRPNTLIKLWTPTEDGGYKLIYKQDDTKVDGIDAVCMEWELLQGKSWHYKYLDSTVLGVKDIFCDDFYREAINIIIETGDE